MSANNTSGAFHHVFRSLAAGQQQPQDQPTASAAEAVPDLNVNDAAQASETTGQVPLDNAQMDVDIPAVVDGTNYDSDDSMPALRDVDDSDESGDEFSDSDSEMDADELEVQLQTVRDQQDSQDTDVTGGASGVSSPSRNNRRARGQHDGDEDRDRRHPSQRTGSESAGGSTPRRTFIHPLHTNPAPNPPQTVPAQAPPPPPNTMPQPPPRTQNLMRLLGFTIDLPTGHVHPLPPTGIPPGAFPPAGAFPLNFAGDVGDLFARLGMAGGLVPEQEDPERAKQLVDGLDEVPIGLVRRLERVGDVAGTDANGTGGDCGCAICWDKLLDGDGNQFGDAQKEGESSSSEGMTEDLPDTTSGSNSTESKSSEQTHPKIVALPCSHVFHASCLIPWFSRPRQTTCPTCRFNIDPENLTYRRRRRNPPPANPTNLPTADTPPAPNAVPPTTAIPATNDTAPPNLPNAIPQPDPAPQQPGIRMNLAPPFGAALFGEFFRAMNAQAFHDAAAHPPPPVFGPAPPPPTNGPAPPPTQAPPQPGFPGEQPQAGNFEFNAGGIVIDLLSMFTGGGIPAQDAAPVPPPAQPVSANAPPTQTAPPTQAPTTEPFDDDDELPGLEPLDMPFAPEPPAAEQPPPPQPHGHPNPHIEHHGDNTFVTLGFDMFIGTGPPPTFGPDDEGPVFDFFQGGVVPDAPDGAAGQPQAGPGGAPFATGRTMEELLSNLTNRLGAQFPPGQAPQPHPQPQHFHPQPAPPPRPRSAPPPQQEQQAQPNPHLHHHHPHAFGLGHPPHFQIPPIHIGHPPPPQQNNAAPGGPQPDGNPQLPHFAQFLSGAGLPGDMGAMPFLDPRATRPFNGRRPPRERKKWTLPTAPGPTLRQRVERKEREANLRCHDMSCGVGPSDEEPDAVVNESQIHIIRGVDGGNVCSHTFHPSCLVTSQRVALKGLEESVNGDCVEVSCPVCRADGLISKVDWDAGAAV